VKKGKDQNRIVHEMAINWVLPVRVAQLVLAIIELGLTAYGM